MPTHAGLLAQARRLGLTDLQHGPDRLRSIGSKIIRCRYDGQRAVAVGSDVPVQTQVGAVLDLLHLHHAAGAAYAGYPVRPDEVTIILGGGPGPNEASDAVRTLAASIVSGPTVRVLTADADGTLSPPTVPTVDLSDALHYPRWAALLNDVATEPPELLCRILETVDHPALRAYPMLTGVPWWSLRLEGLEVGRFRDDKGWLDVGADGARRPDGTIGVSAARRAWQTATASSHKLDLEPTTAAVAHAAHTLTAFASAYLPETPASATSPIKQNEHTLESRVLRGAAQLTTPDGIRLALLRDDPRITWGVSSPPNGAATDRHATSTRCSATAQPPGRWN